MNLKPPTANHAFTRPQWLLIICLAVVAFELGMRFAENNLAEKKAKQIAATNAVTTNFWVMREEAEPIPVEIETNVPTQQTINRPASKPPQTNAYAQSPSGEPGNPGEYRILKGDGPATLRKVLRVTNSFPQYITNTHPAQANRPSGMRFALP